jgi:hypothetical protein
VKFSGSLLQAFSAYTFKLKVKNLLDLEGEQTFVLETGGSFGYQVNLFSPN